MFRLKELEIRNAKGYEEIVIPLENQGAVAINGVNGAGKSTIWDVLQSILFSATPGGHKKDELTKDLKDSYHGVRFSFGADEFLVVHQRVKKKWSYKIEKNGVDITPHNYNDCAKLLKTLVPLTREEFGGSIHLTQGGQHVLIEGAPRDRNLYISRLFGLDDNGDWGKVQLAATGELAKVNARLEELGRLEAKKQALAKTLEDHPDQSELLTNTQSSLTLAQGVAEEWRLYQASAQANLKTWEEYERLRPFKGLESQALLRLTEANQESASLSEQLGRAGAASAANARAREHNAKGESAKSQLATLLASCPEVATFTAEEFNHLKLKVETYDRLKPLLQEMVDLKEVPDTPLDLAGPEEAVTSLTKSITLLQSRYDGIKMGVCHVCGSQHPETEIAGLVAEIADHRDKLEQWKAWVAHVKAVNTRVSRKASLRAVLPEESVPEPTAEERNRLVTLKLAASRKEQYDRLRTIVDSFSEYEILPEPDTGALRQRLDELVQERQKLEAELRLAASCPEPPQMLKEDCEKALIQANEALQKSKDAIQSLLLKTGWLKASSETRARTEQELQALEEKLNDLPYWLREKKFWEKMLQAYGTKGLRLSRLRNIMEAVIRRLPYFMGMLSSEKGLEFTCNVDYDGIEILAHRTFTAAQGKETSFTHDVSGFSGGEKKRLSVALIFALASCVPAKKKSNVVVLDEIDANLDAEGRFRFVNDLLPALKEDYESIFVISHAEEVRMAAIYDAVWRVEKKNHRSTITFSGV